VQSIALPVALTTVADGGRFDEMPEESGKKSNTDGAKTVVKEGWHDYSGDGC
jgi:hypothetical protein